MKQAKSPEPGGEKTPNHTPTCTALLLLTVVALFLAFFFARAWPK